MRTCQGGIKAKSSCGQKPFTRLLLKCPCTTSYRPGNHINMDGQIAHPCEHTGDFLKRGTVVRNTIPRDTVFLHDAGEVGILAEHGNPTKLCNHMIAFIQGRPITR